MSFNLQLKIVELQSIANQVENFAAHLKFLYAASVLPVFEYLS